MSSLSGGYLVIFCGYPLDEHAILLNPTLGFIGFHKEQLCFLWMLC